MLVAHKASKGEHRDPSPPSGIMDVRIPTVASLITNADYIELEWPGLWVVEAEELCTDFPVYGHLLAACRRELRRVPFHAV
jgi:hypothetical protein